MSQDVAPFKPVADGLVSRPGHVGATTTTIMRPHHGSITSSCSSDDDSAVPSSRPTTGERRTMTASNLNLAAGRRKLEEFKRKKALALSKKTQTALSEEKKFEYSEAKLGEAQEEIQRLRAELRAATSGDDRIAGERAAMEREKAALLGEVVGLRSAVSSLEEELVRAKDAAAAMEAAAAETPEVEAAPVVEDERSQAAAIELLRDEIRTMTSRAEGLEQALLESQKALDAVAEEKARLEEQVQELTVKLAVPSGNLAEPSAHATGEDQGHEDGSDARESELIMLRDELETARASLGAAIERSQELQEQVEESREQIDSLRELLAEGEAERVDLVSSMEGLEVSHGQLVKELNEQLEAARMDFSQWKHRAEKAELMASSHRGFLDIASNPQSSSPSEAALRMRLAKAETAVEAERQAYFSLEEKSRHWQEALAENSSLKQCVTELRENEKAMRQYIESMQHGAMGSQVDTDQQQEARIQEMQSQLDESSHTITRLSGEVNDLVSRLKDSEAEKRNTPIAGSNVAAEFDHVSIHGPEFTHAGVPMAPTLPHDDPPHHQGQMSPPVPFAAPPAPAAPAFPPPPSFLPQEPASAEEAASLFDLIDQGPHVPLDAHLPTVQGPPPTGALLAPPPTAFSAPGSQTAPQAAPQQTKQAPEHPLHSQPPDVPPLQPQPPPSPTQAPAAQPTNLMPWSVPGDGPEPLPSPTNAHPPPPEKKPVGFWGWIAGADRVVENN